MSLARVVITPEVFLTCTTHALSTEAEEIMGVLLGHVESVGEGGGAHVYVRRAVPQIRTDRRKDRVETSPEQMATCSALAESVTASTGIPTRVVGWYHSHPHITVLPSHVDVSTQVRWLRRQLMRSSTSSSTSSRTPHVQPLQGLRWHCWPLLFME